MIKKVIAPGDTSKPDPFTVCIISNPAIEAPWKSGMFIPDPISGLPLRFDAAVQYVHDSLFGLLPGQAETMLGDSTIRPKVRVIAFPHDPTLEVEERNALVGQHRESNLLVARRDCINNFVKRHEVYADVVYAISASRSHQRASAWATTDDVASGGRPFTYDGTPLTHCFRPSIVGTVAMHVTASGLTAVHEFQHAIGSFQNGEITDLYVDSAPAINCKRKPPAPVNFCDLGGTIHAVDPTRDHLGYPAAWSSYHCALHAPARPAIMDNYRRTTMSIACENDTVTREFVLKRVRAKLSR